MYLNSRYANGQIINGAHKDIVVQVVTRTFPAFREDYNVYRWKAGDRIDIVASNLGLPRLSWYQILDINPELTSPTMIQPGMIIRVPRT